MSLRATLVASRGPFELDLSFEAAAGEVVALAGQNGAGKSSVLLALAGFLALDGGEIVLDQRVLDQPAQGLRSPPQARELGLVFQDLALFEHMSVIDNVAYGPRARGHRRAAAREIAEQWLARLAIAELGPRSAAALSGGQAQRVALARALAASPRLLLLDEPLAALDADSRARTRALLDRTLASFDGVTVMVTHELDDALALADRLLVLDSGRIIQRGTPAALRDAPEVEHLRAMVAARALRRDLPEV